MTNWYDRIGNEIKMLVEVDHGTYDVIVGTVYAGERYKDGIVSMHGKGGKNYSCGVDSWTLQKTEKTLPDLLTNADRIRKMTDEELNKFLCEWKFIKRMNPAEQWEWLQAEQEEDLHDA